MTEPTTRPAAPETKRRRHRARSKRELTWDEAVAARYSQSGRILLIVGIVVGIIVAALLVMTLLLTPGTSVSG